MSFNVIEVDGVVIRETKKFPVEVTAEAHDLGDTAVHRGKLNLSQIPDDVMFDAEHQNDPHTMIIDGRDVSSDGTKLDTIEVGAEVNNLSDQQAQSLTGGSHSNWHHHDNWYYRRTQLQTSGESQVHWENITNKPTNYTPSIHDHNDIYFTETEITTNYYSKTQLNGGQLDNRYFTETEIITLLAGKSDIGHVHDDRYFTETEITTNYYNKTQTDSLIQAASFGITGSVNTYNDLPTPTDYGVIYIVKTTTPQGNEGFYQWSSGGWVYLAPNTGTTEHNSLPDLNTGNYYHLTQSQFNGLTNGGNTSLHLHDDRYFTESEITSLLTGKSDIGHNHDDRYHTKNYINSTFYTKNQLDGGQLDNRYYTEAEINNLLSSKSNVGHLHDDRYYTESEIDSFLSNKSNVGHNHDDWYYRESEVDTLLSGKSNVSHIHDDRYFTESELQNKIDGLSGADKIGATPLLGGIANTVQGMLEEINAAISFATGSLDEAYDNNGSGAGRVITVDSQAVKLDSTMATNAPLELTNRGGAPTTGLNSGQISVINNQLFIYDGIREKWLTPSKVIVFSLNNNAKGKILSLPGGMRDYNSGWKAAYPGTITSITLQSSDFNNGKSIEILINGSSAHTFYTDASGNYLNTNTNVNFNQGDRIQVFVPNSGGNIFDVSVALEFSWRP